MRSASVTLSRSSGAVSESSRHGWRGRWNGCSGRRWETLFVDIGCLSIALFWNG